MEIEIDSENESQLKRTRKPPLLLGQEESLAKIVKKYPCLFDKNQKMYKEKRHFSKTVHIQNNLFSFFKFLILF